MSRVTFTPDYKIGQEVCAIVDQEKSKRIVTSYTILPGNRLIYNVSNPHGGYDPFYNFEICDYSERLAHD